MDADLSGQMAAGSGSIHSEKLSVIIPAYNEERVIQTTVDEVVAALGSRDFEILVVDDGSRDETHSRVQALAMANSRIRAVRYEFNHGKGYAQRHGFTASHGSLVAFLDADLDIHPRQIITFLEVMERTQADAVIGSKLHPASRIDYPWHRRFMSRVYFWLVRALFGLPVLDTQTGIKLFRRILLDKTLPDISADGFAFDLELLVRAYHLGYKIVDAPVILTFQRGIWGRLGFGAVWQILTDTLRVYNDTHPGWSRSRARVP